MHVRFVGGTRPFELSWDDGHGTASVSAATLEGAVHAAARVLLAQRAFPPVTEPAGETGYAEAMRELIEATARGAQSARPQLRLVR